MGQNCRHLPIMWLAMTLFACCQATSAAEIYSYIDDSGIRHFSNEPDDPRYRVVMRTKGDADRSWQGVYRGLGAELGRFPSAAKGTRLKREHLSRSVERIAREVRLDPALIEAVIQAESAFDPKAISRAGAVGLMQLMPATARRYGVFDRTNPMQNMRGGARYLSDLLKEFEDLPLALAAYNAGEAAVRKYGGTIPPYRETEQYVERVQRFYERYRKERRAATNRLKIAG